MEGGGREGSGGTDPLGAVFVVAALLRLDTCRLDRLAVITAQIDGEIGRLRTLDTVCVLVVLVILLHLLLMLLCGSIGSASGHSPVG